MIRQASLTRLGNMLNTAVGNSKKQGKYEYFLIQYFFVSRSLARASLGRVISFFL